MKKSLLIGGVGYPALELLYRGRTHPAMTLAGALGCLALAKIRKTGMPLAAKALAGACAITGIEYGCGMIFNRRHRIWDYRGMKGNIQGQICPQYFLLWLGMAAGAACIAGRHGKS